MIRRISILAPNLSSNSLGRAYLLARVLQRNYEVEILGPAFQNHIWPPVDDGTVPFFSVPGKRFPLFIGPARQLLSCISGDLVYAVKPRLTSFGLGLLHCQKTQTPLILDIDDWDAEGEYGLNRVKQAVRMVWRLADPYNNLYLRLMERYIPRADAITVVSSALQKRFGGIMLPHGRDTHTLDPACFEPETLKAQYDLSGKFVLMFFGTPRPHKGLEDILTALQQVDLPDLRFAIVGVNWNDPYTQTLQQASEPRLRLFGMQPWTKIPEFLAMADTVVLAQRPVSFGQAQVPAKVFDAMAMAKPIIATQVGDLPEILKDCGVLIPPNNILALAEAIRFVHEHREETAEMGKQARVRCQASYSWDVMEKTLENIIANLEKGKKGHGS